MEATISYGQTYLLNTFRVGMDIGLCEETAKRTHLDQIQLHESFRSSMGNSIER